MFLQKYSSAQTNDTCNRIYEGYIVRVFKKCEPYTVCNFDVFFIRTMPKLKSYADNKVVSQFEC